MPEVGTLMVLQAECRNRDGVLTDPTTIQGWIIRVGVAGVSQALPAFVKQSTGIWESTYTPAVGDSKYRWTVVTTGAIANVQTREFYVEPQLVPH